MLNTQTPGPRPVARTLYPSGGSKAWLVVAALAMLFVGGGAGAFFVLSADSGTDERPEEKTKERMKPRPEKMAGADEATAAPEVLEDERET